MLPIKNKHPDMSYGLKYERGQFKEHNNTYGI